MRHRLKYVRNSYNGKGSLIRGHLQQAPIAASFIGAGGPHQIYEVSATQRYALGTRMVMGDGRVFRYCKATNDCPWDYAYSKCVFANNAPFQCSGTDVATRAAGQPVVRITKANITKNQWVGGFVAVMDATTGVNKWWGARILSNTASDTTVDITLERDLPVAITTSADVVEVQPPIWGSFVESNHAAKVYGMINGVIVVGTYSANDYLWLQTWGELPTFAVANEKTGVESGERAIYARGDGAYQGATAGDGLVQSNYASAMQRIGILPSLSNNGVSGSGEDLPLSYSIGPQIFLQIAP